MILLVHPALEGMHRWRSGHITEFSLKGSIVQPIADSFNARMWPMTVALGVLGITSGVALGFLHLRILTYRKNSWGLSITLSEFEELLNQGENEHVEFKSSLRWDRKLNKVNKALEAVIAKTVSGFLNHQGGILLIGVDDDKSILGIEADWKSLRYPNWDGFEERFVSLITSHIGAQFSSLIHSECIKISEKPVAVIRIEPSSVPVFCRDSNVHRYYLRAGNTTRKLDTQEALAHVEGRKVQTS